MANRNFELNKETKKKVKPVRFRDTILFEDDNVVVINKPCGVATLEDRAEGGVSLLRLARKYHEGLKACHRLDKYTSGVLVFAKNPETYRAISIQFQDREVIKHYLAVVDGVRDFEEFVINAPLHTTASGKVKVHFGAGKEAVTVLDTEEKYRNHTLVSCQPLTGRMHQIRVHLASIGCPIVGDADYGGQDLLLSSLKRNYKLNRRDEVEQPVNDHYLLHARGSCLACPAKKNRGNSWPPSPKTLRSPSRSSTNTVGTRVNFKCTCESVYWQPRSIWDCGSARGKQSPEGMLAGW